MNLRQLEAFRATMRSGSMTGAAGILSISQPSISRLIADLERSVGFGLFTRSGRGLEPTPEARRFHDAIEGTFIGVERLRELAVRIRTTAGGTVSVGVIQSIAMLELPRALTRLREAHPQVRVMIECRNTPAIHDAVMLNHFDLGVVGRQPAYAGVETLFATSAPYLCILPEDHPLADAAGPVDLWGLADTEEFITFGGAFPDAMMAMEPALSQRLQARSRLSATNMPVAAALVRETGALAIADPFSAEQAVRMGGVVFRPIRQRLTYHLALIARNAEALSPAGRDLAAIIAARIEERLAALARHLPPSEMNAAANGGNEA